MFDKTWQWAGTFRQSNKNIGVDWPQVSVKLRELIDNTRYQIDNQVFNEDEIAVRFHHQLVWIHVFPNGNGRHARMMTDLLITQLGQPKLTWGSNNTLQASVETIRQSYLAALREADQGDINSLLAFARS